MIFNFDKCHLISFPTKNSLQVFFVVMSNILNTCPYFRCNILDSHLEKLAKDHLECRFIKLNVEKAPFLTERLGIRVIPTMSILKEGKTLVNIY